MPQFTFTQIDVVALAGSLGTIATAVLLYWLQGKSSKAQALFTKQLTADAMKEQAAYAHGLATTAARRQTALQVFADLNNHAQAFVYAFANMHPQNVPRIEMFPDAPRMLRKKDPEAIHERGMALSAIISALNTDRMMLGFIFGGQVMRPTGELIDALVNEGTKLLESSEKPKSANEHFKINSELVHRIAKSLLPLWQSLEAEHGRAASQQA